MPPLTLRSGAIVMALYLGLAAGTFRFAELFMTLGIFGDSRLKALAMAFPLATLPIMVLTLRCQLLKTLARRRWYIAGLAIGATASLAIFALTSLSLHGLASFTPLCCLPSALLSVFQKLSELGAFILYAGSALCLFVEECRDRSGP